MLVLSSSLNIANIKVTVNIDTRLCYINDLSSSTGKTYLANLLKLLLGNKCILINYNTSNNSVVSEMISGIKTKVPLIIFDNADLYMDDKLCNLALKVSDTVIVIGRHCLSSEEAYSSLYSVNWSRNEISLKRS